MTGLLFFEGYTTAGGVSSNLIRFGDGVLEF